MASPYDQSTVCVCSDMYMTPVRPLQLMGPKDTETLYVDETLVVDTSCSSSIQLAVIIQKTQVIHSYW